MRIVKVLAIAFGVAIGVIGVLGVAAPSVLLDFVRSLQTTNAHYIVAAVRLIFGVILLSVASVSRTPKILRVLGAFIIIAGVITPFLGVERHRAILDWYSSQGSLFTRAWGIVAVVFGVFIVYAVASPRRSAA